MLGAQSMVTASYTLAKSLHDYPAMLNALAAVTQFHEHNGDPDSVDKNAVYTEGKLAIFQQQIQLAVVTQEHVQIMQWQGDS